MLPRALNTCFLLLVFLLSTTTRCDAQVTYGRGPEAGSLHTGQDTAELLSMIWYATGQGNQQPDSALLLLEEARRLSYLSGYSFGIAKSLQLSGIINSHTGRYEEAIAHLQRLIYYCLRTGKHTDLLSIGYNIIANIYQSQGKYQEAAYYYHQTLRLPKGSISESTTSLIYTNLSRLMHKLRQPQQALHYLDRAEQIATRNNNYDLICIINSNKGMIYADITQPDSAKFFLRKAAHLIETYNRHYDLQLQDVAYTNTVYLADLWLKEGNTDSAAPCIARIREVQVPIIPLYRNKGNLTIGKYYLATSDYKNAENYLHMALDSAEQVHIGNYLAEIHITLADLYTQTAQYQKALLHKDRYIQLKDSLENQAVASNVHQLEIRYRTAEKDNELISQKLEISRQQSDAREKNLWIAIITGGMIVLAITLAALYKKRQAEKRLQIKEIQILRQRQQAMQQQQQAMQQAQEIEQLKAMMKGEERERGRLARELHDGIGGMLTAIKMNLGTTQRKNPELTSYPSLAELMQMLEDTSSEVRKTAHNLMPDVLLRNSLPEALMIFCSHIHKELPTELSCQGDFSQLDKATELMLYRMTQELIQNVLKHASATKASIELIIFEGKLILTVEDNGTGFDPDQEMNGFGLQNLRYRVAALQGNMSITSDKNKSTIIHLEFELDKLRMS